MQNSQLNYFLFEFSNVVILKPGSWFKFIENSFKMGNQTECQLSFLQFQPMKPAEIIYNRQDVVVCFSFVTYRLRLHVNKVDLTCNKTSSTLADRGIVLFVNFTLSLWYFELLFVTWRTWPSLNPVSEIRCSKPKFFNTCWFAFIKCFVHNVFDFRLPHDL